MEIQNNAETFSLDYTCRTCLKYNENEILTPIFDNCSQPNAIEIFNSFSFLELNICENDGLPQNICADCIRQLCSANEFRMSCEKSQHILQKYFADKEEKPIPDICIKTEPEMISDEIHVDDIILNEMIECKICNSLYADELLLFQHITDEHQSVTLVEENLEDFIKLDDDGNELPENFYCELCQSEFESIEILNHHMKINHQKGDYTCPICGKIIQSASNLKHHIDIHNDKNTCTCDICGQGFKCKKYLSRHLKKHEPNRKYKCEYCDKAFLQKHHRVNHERTHTGERPYLCNVCGKSFSNKQNFQVHTMYHTGERRYKCDECDKAFVEGPSLKIHKQRMHSNTAKIKQMLRDTEERNYPCEECGNSFKRAEHLKLHIKRIHLKQKPYSCDVCGKGFTLPSDLKPHMMVHTGEKPHNCPFCPRKFTLAKSMRDHAMRIHKSVIQP